jgi:class 3 adenylate cyclase
MPESRPLTLLFADVSGSTKLFEQRGDVVARQLIAKILDALSAICRRHSGRVVKTIGDEIMCVLPTAMDGVDAAVAMQRHVATDPTCVTNHLAIRIGLHDGECLVEDDGDVYGDAVNTAARMAKLAGREQIVTTAATVAGLKHAPVRSLGTAQVSGKLQAIDIVDIIWQENPAGMTTVQSALGLGHAPALENRLVLEFKGRTIELGPASPPLTLGRDPGSTLVVESDCVSRSHAVIEFQRGQYVLTDRSTNGSFLRIEGDDEQRVHRDEAKLRRSGVISLGKGSAQNADALIFFRCP